MPGPTITQQLQVRDLKIDSTREPVVPLNNSPSTWPALTLQLGMHTDEAWVGMFDK